MAEEKKLEQEYLPEEITEKDYLDWKSQFPAEE